MKIVGQPLPHDSAADHVTGAALFVGDLAARDRTVLHAWPVTAPYAHAVVTYLDVTPAMLEPGVVTTLTDADVPGEGDSGYRRRDEPLFPKLVLYHRQPVAWVIAETREAARRGAARVEANYATRPLILTIPEAITAQSFHEGPLRIQSGNAPRALEESANRLEGELYVGGQEHFYLETQVALARLEEGGAIRVDTPTQHPAATQEVVARVLGLQRNQVTVVCTRIGGGFGGKETQANPWAAIAALGAWKTGRAVEVRLSRTFDMALTGKRHPCLARFAVGFAGDGAVEALQLSLYLDGGYSFDLSGPALWGAMLHCDNAYRIPNTEITGWVTKTHKTSQTAFRGFGAPQGMVIIEDVIDRIARTLGIPPDRIRQRNFYAKGHTTHYGQPVKNAERLDRIWRTLRSTSAFDKRRKEIDRFNAASAETKRGLAITPVKLGISFVTKFLNQGSALVLIYRDGSVQVNHGGTEMGQGLHTKIRQIAAESLGHELSSIRVMPTRTDKVPNTSPTAASVGTDLNGAAVADACKTLVGRLRPVAAQVLGCRTGEVRFNGGRAQGPSGAISLAAIADQAYLQRISLLAEGHYKTPDVNFNEGTGQGAPYHYFAFGAAVCEVEVNAATGAHRVLRVDVIEDVGDSVSPLIDLGQVEGGFVQGLGWLTSEELVWDERGRLLTDCASTYTTPSFGDIPALFNVAFLPRTAEPGVIFGSKAVGEPPLMLAISAREAIRDAIAAYGALGPVLLDSPATPERIFWAIKCAQGMG